MLSLNTSGLILLNTKKPASVINSTTPLNVFPPVQELWLAEVVWNVTSELKVAKKDLARIQTAITAVRSK